MSNPKVLPFELCIESSITSRKNHPGKGYLIQFDPVNVKQRHSAAINILEDPRWNHTFKKVVNFGRGEINFLPLLRRISTIEHILQVSFDKKCAELNKLGANPSKEDYIRKREFPLRIEVLHGYIDARVEDLRNVDAVVALEVIEHFKKDNLKNVAKNIFGFVKPKLAIFSTPNRDFNALFSSNLASNGLRIEGHQYELNRRKFKNWALEVCRTYDNYNVYIVGVGEPLTDRPDVGHATQIAIFERINNRKRRGKQMKKNKRFSVKRDIPADSNPDVQFKEIYVVDYPFATDTRSIDQKIMDAVGLHRRNKLYFNQSRRIYQIPLMVFKPLIGDIGATKLRDILLTNNIEVEGDFFNLPEE